MNPMKKLKEKGLKGLLVSAGYKARHINEKAMASVFKRFPIDEKKLIFESEGDYSDNARALYEELVKENKDKDYTIYWLCDDPEAARIRWSIPAIKKRGSLKTLYHLCTCSKYIYDHNHLLHERIRRKNQTAFYLGHGIGFKGSMNPSTPKNLFTCSNTTGKLGVDCMSVFWNCDKDQVVELGYPRLDVLFEPENLKQKRIRERLFQDPVSKLVLWMPTFRKSDNQALNLKNCPSVPMFETAQDFENLNEFLKKENMGMVLKIHHLAAQDPLYQQEFSNLKFLTDEDLADLDVSLYEFVVLFDALVTDYSSISTDYLALNRPIIYQLQDYEAFEKERGLWLKNALDYMPGDHCFNKDQLYQALSALNGEDQFIKEREKMIPLFFKYPDGNSSKRIIEYLGL